MSCIVFKSIGLIPNKIIRSIKKKFNSFLWNGKDDGPARAKVSWDSVCIPKEGGLGLERIEEWNKAAVLRHIRNLFSKAGSLWVACLKVNLLKGRYF